MQSSKVARRTRNPALAGNGILAAMKRFPGRSAETMIEYDTNRQNGIGFLALFGAHDSLQAGALGLD